MANTMTKRKILVTSALPNAKGSIHPGHFIEHIQTDIRVRFQRMRGHQCIYICADDTHGTAIMLKAEEPGIFFADLQPPEASGLHWGEHG